MKALITGASGFIGGHLVTHLHRCGYQVFNLDVNPPRVEQASLATWRECSILDSGAIARVFAEIRPECVIHLAAYASMEAKSLEEFTVNTEGTANILHAAGRTSSVQRLIVTSTQHVRRPGSGMPAHDEDFLPYGFYGESKVLTEQLTRKAGLNCAWTIIRPTAVWGPGNILLANGVWRQMHKGRYFHPRKDAVVRSYGYVKNVVWQIEGLLRSPQHAVAGKVFYVADGNSKQLDWVNAVSRELIGRNVRTVPVSCLRMLSTVGNGLRSCGISFPLYGSRFHNLITPNPVPTEPILDLLGPPPISLAQGARETADWLKLYYAK